jgi:hypothetical protein
MEKKNGRILTDKAQQLFTIQLKLKYQQRKCN